MSVDQVERVKRRIDPSLETPYFVMREKGVAKCSHVDVGVELDEANRTAICRGCKQPVDLFDALWNYAESERRLVLAAERIKKFSEEKDAKNQRNRERMNHVKKVISSKPRWTGIDSENMEQDGHTLTLECTHEMIWKQTRIPNEATCQTCRRAAKKK